MQRICSHLHKLQQIRECLKGWFLKKMYKRLQKKFSEKLFQVLHHQMMLNWMMATIILLYLWAVKNIHWILKMLNTTKTEVRLLLHIHLIVVTMVLIQQNILLPLLATEIIKISHLELIVKIKFKKIQQPQLQLSQPKR